jgi:hypothetical protein
MHLCSFIDNEKCFSACASSVCASSACASSVCASAACASSVCASAAYFCLPAINKKIMALPDHILKDPEGQHTRPARPAAPQAAAFPRMLRRCAAARMQCSWRPGLRTRVRAPCAPSSATPARRQRDRARSKSWQRHCAPAAAEIAVLQNLSCIAGAYSKPACALLLHAGNALLHSTNVLRIGGVCRTQELRNEHDCHRLHMQLMQLAAWVVQIISVSRCVGVCRQNSAAEQTCEHPIHT